MMSKGKSTEPKYSFTTAQVTYKNGETYKICSVCGKECKSNMGIEMSWNTRASFGGLRIGYCYRCAKKYSKMIDDFAENILDYARSERGGLNDRRADC